MRIVVYTVILGGYDYLFPTPVDRTADGHDIDWVLISDRKPLLAKGWRWQPIPAEARQAGDSTTRINRYCKFFPHKLFPQADLSIYLDGNVPLKRGIGAEITRFLETGAGIGLGYVQDRQTIQEEVAFCAQTPRFSQELVAQLRAQVAAYEARGLPDTHRLYAGRVIFRRHAGAGVRDAMQAWWEEFTQNGLRDQISLPFVLHTHGVQIHAWAWDYRGDKAFFHVARHKPPRAWTRPEAFVEAMRHSRPWWAWLYRYMAPFYRLRQKVRKRKYG